MTPTHRLRKMATCFSCFHEKIELKNECILQAADESCDDVNNH